MRKALELTAGLEGSTTATYATQLLSQAIKNEIKEDPIIFQKWIELEKEALRNESWDEVVLPLTISPEDLQDTQPSPKGWFLSGDSPNNYVVGKDRKVPYRGIASGYIKSKQDKTTGFGTIMQQTDIIDYIGKKLEFSAVIKTNKVKDWAGLWVRLDDSDMKLLWFDNMQDRPIKGTNDWKKFQIIFDVPNKSSNLNFGVLLVGPGSVWVNSVSLNEIIGNKKKSTSDLDLSLSF